MTFTIEFDRETDGRWIAEIPILPGVMVYGDSREEAEQKVEALAREVVNSNELQFEFAVA